MKPNILAILPGLIPSTIINVTTPLIDLHKAGLIKARVTLEIFTKDKGSYRNIESSDLIVFCRNVEPAGVRWLSKILEYKTPYIYDIDDNLFELPLDTLSGKYHRSPERIAMLEEYIRHANLVRVYSEPMLERARSLNPNSVKVNGPVDWRLLSPSPKRAGTGPVKIVYATSRVNDNLAELFKPALKRILEKYPDQVQVHFLGYNPPEFKAYTNVFFKPLTLNYEKYLRYFSGAGFDIGLAPLLDDIFHRSKSNLKVREYGACRIAGIYSDVDVYSTTVTHRETGLLVKNDPDEWFAALSEMIENHELRRYIQEKGYQLAQKRFSQVNFNRVWYQQITETLQQPLKRKESHQAFEKLKLLDEQQASLEIFDKDYADEIKPGLVKFLSMLLRLMGFPKWFQRKTITIILRLRSEEGSFLFHTIKMYIKSYGESFWILMKIRFQLFWNS